MAFTNIPNANLQVGAPLRSVDILALRDNIPAVMNGDTGAPKIKAAAFQGQFGAAPVFAARAWVQFRGTSTVTIRASGNVSSVTDLGVGEYGVNFTTAMPDENFSVAITAGFNSGGFGTQVAPVTYLTTSVLITLLDRFGNIVVDSAFVNVAIFR